MASASQVHPKRLRRHQKPREPLIFKGFPGLFCIKVERVLDPACGTAGFLVSAAEYIRKHYEATMTAEQWRHFAGDAFTGFDTDRTMLRISAMNLMLHSISHPEIDYKDRVSKQNQIQDQFTMCLANPPFKGTVEYAGREQTA